MINLNSVIKNQSANILGKISSIVSKISGKTNSPAVSKAGSAVKSAVSGALKQMSSQSGNINKLQSILSQSAQNMSSMGDMFSGANVGGFSDVMQSKMGDVVQLTKAISEMTDTSKETAIANEVKKHPEQASFYSK